MLLDVILYSFVYLCMYRLNRLVCDSYDHQERLTAEEAMAHPYFAPVRMAAEAAAASSSSSSSMTSP
jgi:hypothetical protein